jgi:hypothetical protein
MHPFSKSTNELDLPLSLQQAPHNGERDLTAVSDCQASQRQSEVKNYTRGPLDVIKRPYSPRHRKAWDQNMIS